ncbi:MAG: hypothetical protein HQK54_12840, partial [Oligoflexales bacterium]|nr:hypothetical protein [Oligoflexales bacterium]
MSNSLYLFFLIMSILLSGCINKTKFGGTNDKASKSGDQERQPSSSDPQQPPQFGDSPVSSDSPAAMTPRPCTEKINYDPSQILCALPEIGRPTIWDATDPWKTYVSNLRNKAAFWISPLAAQVSNDRRTVFCPFIPD